ncbi:molybdopterin-binding protein [Corynebacterium choanae]|nr:molybdopterin-binding protein [Corynebacterium choanae]
MSESLTAAIVVVSDRIVAGQRDNTVTPLLQDLLAAENITVIDARVIEEGFDPIATTLDELLREQPSLIITAGGTGIGRRNMVPEATALVLATRLAGIEHQVLRKGLDSTPLAGLSRGMIGVTGRDSSATIIANAPSSTGGVKDLAAVLLPLLPNIREGLTREER